jgi:glycosyltransferase involved in cell wall biosynthesis
MYQLLGHITHDQRLRLEVAKDPEIQPKWMPILPRSEDRWQRLPVIKDNFTLLGGLRARDQLGRHTAWFNALYCHTQEPAVLLGKYMKRIPTILSMDATPINMDSIGHAYGHSVASKPIEHVKLFLIKRTFERAAHLVTFSRWAKDSLINDYGISEKRITVNAPGPDLGLWNISEEERTKSQNDLSPHVLFVGGDFRRKGGETLIQCAASAQGKWSVDIVTGDNARGAEGIPNLRVHRGLKTGTRELLSLYRKANIFALPTLSDCYSWVILEAMAMRLPVVATPVGAIPELVIPGETGLLIPPNSPEALIEAIRELGKDPERRLAMGNAGRQRVEQFFDGARSYRRLIALIKSIADENRRPHGAIGQRAADNVAESRWRSQPPLT